MAVRQKERHPTLGDPDEQIELLLKKRCDACETISQWLKDAWEPLLPGDQSLSIL